ncbi:MAG TPA: UbiD family decarboxylase [Pirellulales bacterium]|jgi:4-hydroxy-3-polyprenylbenzoate decarboxylase|nr:UbiD family decarboxylase [Pirellulales bacterium]
MFLQSGENQPLFALADFIEQLERAGQLVRVPAEVNPELEIAAIARRVVGEGGPALFFENVRGCRVPVVTNLLGTSQRARMALGGAAPDDVVERIERWLSPTPGTTAGWFNRLRGEGDPPTAHEPRVVRAGPVQQVVELGRDVDLNAWPAPRAWAVEARRSITAGQLVTCSPSANVRSIESVAVEVLNRDRLGLAGDVHRRWRRTLAEHQAAGSSMPVALVLGCDPVLVMAASPMASMFDPLLLAGLIADRPIDLVKCRTHDLHVPAEAELVIEGTIDPSEPTIPAGPIASETGYAAPAGELRVLRVAAITYRLNPVFPAAAIGPPPSESSVVRDVVARWLRPLLKQTVPELVDYDLGCQFGPRQFAVVSIRKTYPQQARRVLAAMWGLDWLMFTKLVVVVDEHVDVHDPKAVLRAVGANVDVDRDLVRWTGPAASDDHAANDSRLGHRLGIDATAKLPEEAGNRWPARLTEAAEIIELLDRRWKEYFQ